MTYLRYSRHLACLLIASAIALTAQTAPRTAGEKSDPNRESPSLGDPAATYSGDLKSMAKPQKATAFVSALDLNQRSITMVPAKKGGKFRVASLDDKGRAWGWADKINLGFPVPAGMEKIKTTKKSAKALGKKQLSLEQLPVGSKVKVEYYPVLKQILEITVHEAGKGTS